MKGKCMECNGDIKTYHFVRAITRQLKVPFQDTWPKGMETAAGEKHMSEKKIPTEV